MTPGSTNGRQRPVLFHVHGLGEFDFSSLRPEDLPAIQRAAVDRGVDLVPTIFLRQNWLGACVALIRSYSSAREQFPNILGFAIEGPLLGPSGGTPRSAAWMPTVDEWQTIASLGSLGLRYLVLAPDAMDTRDLVARGCRLIDLIELFSEHDVRIALGHFERSNPERSAERALSLIEAIHDVRGLDRFNVLTDHLYNDMPRNFTHAWRGEAKVQRAVELEQFLGTSWVPGDLNGLLGPVPSALLEAARGGRLLPCLNFDGYHVDLAICRRTVDFVGADSLIAITDHTETVAMAGEELHPADDSSLWYREDEIVAAGRMDLDWQIKNMRAIELSEREIDLMTNTNPHCVLGGNAIATV